MGIPVISDGTDGVIDAIYDKFKGIPFVRPYSTLEDTIVNLRDDRDAWATAAAVGHQHYLDYHSYEAASKLAIWVYEQAIEHFGLVQEATIKGKLARMPTLFEAESLILIRYLGKNSGETKWFPDNGTRTTYTFSELDPLRYVYEPDALWFLEQEAKNGKPLFAKEDA